MNDDARHTRNAEKLVECYEPFRRRAILMLADLEIMGLRPRVQCAWRSEAEQRRLQLQGRSKVTWGPHNAVDGGGDPEALAIDVLDDDAPLAPSGAYLLRLAVCAEKHGMRTGIRWGLAAGEIVALDRAMGGYDWAANVKTGWDATHCEAPGSYADMRRGWRPWAE